MPVLSLQPRRHAHRARRTDQPGADLALVLLAVEPTGPIGVDLDSGALVRAWLPDHTLGALDGARSYDVVVATLDDEPDLDVEPTQPESVAVAGTLRVGGGLSSRRVEQLLRPLVHPPDRPLLGTREPVAHESSRIHGHPSVAVVEPRGRSRLVERHGWIRCQFAWAGHRVELGLSEEAAHAGAGLANLEGVLPARCRLLVAFSRPVDGRCYKTVSGILPRS